MNSLTQQDTWSEDVQLPASHGFLKHDILERICLFLPNQQDLYNACFINQAWRYAARKVLWESPVFRTPTSFKDFLRIVDRERGLALLVKNLTLCLPDTPSTTLFNPVNRSELDRHMIKINIMSRPHIIHHLAEFCQQLDSLTIYGWNLQQRDFDKLYSYLPWLKNLKVIGTNDDFYKQAQYPQQQSCFQLNTFFPRLSQLTLDGLFPISRSFAQAINAKAQNLTSLHLSLYSMDSTIFEALCKPGTILDLRELTLTHAIPLNDNYINQILRRFSKLRLFCLEGTENLTANALRIAMNECHYLQHLEIRQRKMGKPIVETTEGMEQDDWQLQTLGTDIRTLLIENMWLYDGTLDNIAYYCPMLTNLGLSHGGSDLSDIGIEALVRASLTFLRHIQLLHCPMVTSKALTYLPMPSLYSLHLESNGKIEPVDIFNVCSRAVIYANEHNLRPNLRRVCLVGYENIATSVVGTHAIERVDYQAKQWSNEASSSLATNYQVTLNEQAIDALAHSDEFVVVPPTKILTGNQIIELARKLQMPLNQFVQLLNEFEGPNPNTNHIPHTETTEPTVETIPEVPSPYVNRLKKSTLQNGRPSTPALWADAANDPDTLQSHKQHAPPARSLYSSQASVSGPSFTLPQKSDPDSSASDTQSSRSQSQASESELDQLNNNDSSSLNDNNENSGSYNKEDWPDLQNNNGEHISTGGWGMDFDSIPWTLQKKKSATVTNAQNGSTSQGSNNHNRASSYSNDVSINSNSNNNNNNNNSSSSSNGNMNSGANWGASTEENHEAHWRVETMDAPVPKKKGHTNLDVEADRWGPPKKVLSWQDTKPFVDDVLKTQDETIYWHLQNGNWQKLHGNEATSSTTTTKGHTNGQTSFSNERRSNRFSSTPTESTSLPNRSTVVQPAATVTHTDHTRYSLSSDDSDVDWDDDDGITIKIGQTYNEPKQSRFARSAQPTYTTPITSTKTSPTTRNSTNPWRQFADHEKGIKETTSHSSISRSASASASALALASASASVSTSASASASISAVAATSSAMDLAVEPVTNANETAEKVSNTPLLVDTSDEATIVGTTNWNNHETRNVLHDWYQSMTDFELNGQSEPEAIAWTDDDNNTKDADHDDRGTIGMDNITDNDLDDSLLQLDSALSTTTTTATTNTTITAPDMNNNDNNSNTRFIGSPLINSSANTSTSILQPSRPNSSQSNISRPLMTSTDSTISTTTTNGNFSPMELLLDNLPTTSTTMDGAAAAPSKDTVLGTTTTATTSYNDILQNNSPLNITMSMVTPAVRSTTNIASHGNDVHSNGTPPEVATVTSSTTLTDSSDPAATDSAITCDRSSSTPKTPAGDDVFLRLSLRTPTGNKLLLLSEKAADLKGDVHRFCAENDMLEIEDQVYDGAYKEYMEKNANLVLGGAKKKKKKKKEKEPKKKQAVISPSSS